MKKKSFLAVLLVFSILLCFGCASQEEKLQSLTGTNTKEIADKENEKEVMQSASRDINGRVKEKVGKFFVWTGRDKESDKSTLYISPSGSNTKKKTVIKIAKKGTSIDENIVSNGNTVYFAAVNDQRDKNYNTKGQIFQFSILETEKAESKKKVNPDEEVELEEEPEILTEIDELSGFIGYYNGLVYFSRNSEENSDIVDLYSCDPETKEQVLVKENFSGEQYGKYILGSPICQDPEIEYILLDLETKEVTQLPEAANMTMTGEHIIYLRDNDEEQSIHQCDLSGEKDEVIQKLDDETICYYLGRDYAQILYDDKMMQLNYESGTFEEVEFEFDEIYELVLEEYRAAITNDLYEVDLEYGTDDMSAIGDYVNLELFSAARDSDKFEIYYVLSDLNDDGRNELILGAGSEAEIILYDIFSYEMGKPSPVFDRNTFGYRSRLYIHEDGTFSVMASGGYDTGEIAHYCLPKKSTVAELIDAYGIEEGEEYYSDCDGNKNFGDAGQYEIKIQEAMNNIREFNWIKICAD